MACLQRNSPCVGQGPPQIRAVWLGGQQIFPIAIHGFFLIQLKADFSPLCPLRQGLQRVLVVEIDGSVDEGVLSALSAWQKYLMYLT